MPKIANDYTTNDPSTIDLDRLAEDLAERGVRPWSDVQLRGTAFFRPVWRGQTGGEASDVGIELLGGGRWVVSGGHRESIQCAGIDSLCSTLIDEYHLESSAVAQAPLLATRALKSTKPVTELSDTEFDAKVRAEDLVIEDALYAALEIRQHVAAGKLTLPPEVAARIERMTAGLKALVIKMDDTHQLLKRVDAKTAKAAAIRATSVKLMDSSEAKAITPAKRRELNSRAMEAIGDLRKEMD